MGKFIIPVQRVEMSGEDFDDTRKAIMDLEFENNLLKTQVNQLEKFITKITSMMIFRGVVIKRVIRVFMRQLPSNYIVIVLTITTTFPL